MAKHEATRVQEPARKRHTGLIVFLALILLLAAAVAFAYFSVQREIHGSGATGEAVTVTVEQGSGPAKIAAPMRTMSLRCFSVFIESSFRGCRHLPVRVPFILPFFFSPVNR